MTPRYLELLHPEVAVASLAALNDYGFLHEQTARFLAAVRLPLYRTDQNGTVVIRSPGVPRGGYTIEVERGTADMRGPSDRHANERSCAGQYR